MEYNITKIENCPNWLHVEFNFALPDGKIEEQQMNLGKNMLIDNAWKPHIEDYIEKQLEHANAVAKAKEENSPDEFKEFLGKHKIKKAKKTDGKKV